MTDASILARAWAYEAAESLRVTDRPAFHLTPRVGWMNDPNGFSYHDGAYHLFYQYHPYSMKWGPMHWGHAVSQDLLHWTYLPAALAPDSEADGGGCFSGSALTLPDGRHLLMYTGIQRESGAQQQCLAVGDGRAYEKYPGNPVLTRAELPEGFTDRDFRDPKIWRASDGTYRCVTGAMSGDGSGAALLFASEDAFTWRFVTVLDRSRNALGKMWECPDFFLLDDRAVLLVSPCEMAGESLGVLPGSNSLALLGTWDESTGTFHREQVQLIDHGLDFYAPQTTLAPDGRRILVAWMQNWAFLDGQPPQQRWFGQMTLPRELFFRRGRLCQRPIREISSLHTNHVSFRNQLIQAETTLPGIHGRKLDMTLRVRPRAGCAAFRVGLNCGGGLRATLIWRIGESLLHFDRSALEVHANHLHERTCRVFVMDGELSLRILLDRNSVEVFAGEGETTMSSVVYPPDANEGITFQADGGAELDIDKYDLDQE